MRPLPVQSALVLLWSALAIMVAASLAYYASSAALLLVGDMLSHLLGYTLLALLWLGLARGNHWARVFFVIFLAWNLVLTALNLLFESRQLPWLLALDVVIVLLQVCAAFLLFRPSSNDWFRGPAAAASSPAPAAPEGGD